MLGCTSNLSYQIATCSMGGGGKIVIGWALWLPVLGNILLSLSGIIRIDFYLFFFFIIFSFLDSFLSGCLSQPNSGFNSVQFWDKIQMKFISFAKSWQISVMLILTRYLAFLFRCAYKLLTTHFAISKITQFSF